jgi:hypothetical protein
MIAVLVPAELAAPGTGFSFKLPPEVAESAESGTVRVSRADGRKLPAWLRYLPHNQALAVSAAPAGALPIEVLVRIGGQRWTLLIAPQVRH